MSLILASWMTTTFPMSTIAKSDIRPQVKYGVRLPYPHKPLIKNTVVFCSVYPSVLSLRKKRFHARQVCHSYRLDPLSSLHLHNVSISFLCDVPLPNCVHITPIRHAFTQQFDHKSITCELWACVNGYLHHESIACEVWACDLWACVNGYLQAISTISLCMCINKQKRRLKEAGCGKNGISINVQYFSKNHPQVIMKIM